MRYWWVNQNQTFKQEVDGGYLWSPQTKANGGINPFYEFMRLVAPGDLILSFQGTYIRAIGIARSSCYPAPKPPEFGKAGPNWKLVGWRIDVKFIKLQNQIKPAAHLDLLRPFLPKRYSPIQHNTGRGNQGVYLTAVPPEMACSILRLIGEEADAIKYLSQHDESSDYEDVAVGLVEWEEHLIHEIEKDLNLADTEKKSVVLARRGQGTFKQNVLHHEHQCRITKVARIEHLRASHIKPWRNCDSPEERLAGTNGLLLTPTVDHLFDRGFISFENNGELIISDVTHKDSIRRMGINPDKSINVGKFSSEQRDFLNYHRDRVFLQARLK